MRVETEPVVDVVVLVGVVVTTVVVTLFAPVG